MTNLQNFAAQRLTKRQMNDIRGGQEYLCACYVGDKPLTTTDQVRSTFIAHDENEAIFMLKISCQNGGACTPFA